MDISYRFIEVLKKKIERKVGHPLKSPTDFNRLSLLLSEELNEQVSTSTIKRLWGYIPYEHQPRHSTLSLLCRFVGYRDWEDYCFKLQDEDVIDSDFLSEYCIRSKSLSIGDLIELGWEPDRYCKIQYMGDNHFVVLEARQSKIKQGNRFKCLTFYLNQPLYLSEFYQDDTTAKEYLIAPRSGIKHLRLLPLKEQKKSNED